jgi:hypothetical protein
MAHLADAQLKEGGLDPGVISYLLSQVSVINIPEYVLDRVSAEELNAFIRKLQRQFAALAFPPELPHE